MKRLGRRIHGHERAVAALGVTAAAAVALVVGSMVEERRSKQTTNGSSVTGQSLPAVSEPPVTMFVPPVSRRRLRGRDYVLDLTTSAWSPLPKAILRSRVAQIKTPRYAASPNGSRLAYVGRGDEGRPQIFVAGIDGAGIHQLTHDPRGAGSPAWSPDGTKIAYEGYGSRHRDRVALFVLDIATGESRRIIGESRDAFGTSPQFTPDGSSLLYTGGTDTAPVIRTVSIAGGRSALLIGPGDGLNDAGNGSLSPDGSLITFLASGTPPSVHVGHCGPCRWLANADGTNIESCSAASSRTQPEHGRPTAVASCAWAATRTTSSSSNS